MYKDEQKAFLMIKDPKQRDEVAEYIYQRYNLRSETADDILGVFNLLSADNSPDSTHNLVILDETVAGLQTTSHALKTIKTKYIYLNVLYLSSLLEMMEPYKQAEMEMFPEYEDDEYTEDQIDMHLDRLLSLQMPITKVTSLAEAYETIPRIMLNDYHLDWAVCSVLRLDEKPVQRGVVASNYPPVLEIPQEFFLKGTGCMDDLITHYKPVHIPDLTEDEAFGAELKEKFSREYRSALLMPMQHDGKAIGFLGMFTRSMGRLYRLPDLDLLQRFADMSTVAIITHFYKENSSLDMDRIEKEVKEKDWDDMM